MVVIDRSARYSCGSYHRVVLPGEDREAVLVIIEQLLDLRPHAFGLTLQQDEDGLRTQLQQVQKTLSENTHRVRIGHSGDSNTDLKWYIVMMPHSFY